MKKTKRAQGSARSPKAATTPIRHGQLDRWIETLRGRNLRITQPRKQIINALLIQHGPFTAEEIHQMISKKVCDLATVYRSLTTLEAEGVLTRCEFGDGSARYELAHGGAHHHHIICRKCKRVEVLNDCELDELDRLAERHGFSEVSHMLEFFGLCQNCQAPGSVHK